MKFEFTIDQINLILTGLSELPYKATFQIIEEIKKQAQPQLDKKPDEVPNTDTDTP